MRKAGGEGEGSLHVRVRRPRVELLELRVLDGPNLYFTRPSIKLTLAVPGWLRATEQRLRRVAVAAGMPGVAPGADPRSPIHPGPPRTEHRRRFVVRLTAHLTRSLAEASRTRLAVRTRAGFEDDEIVVAFPWRRRDTAEALGREVFEILRRLLGSDGSAESVQRLVRRSAERLAAIDPGPRPEVPDPRIPVIAVTGTNGKTTTVRLLAHIIGTAGKTAAFSSTDGVYADGRLVAEGDYSGFAGAARAMAQEGVEVAVLETARGGILLRGIGTLHNDVAVVTNVSADHLGLHGIRTLDQLAEVKSTITRITRAEGWDVLNADDPRVLAMRRGIRGRPWLFSVDPEHPALRAALEERGRGITVIDRKMVVLEPGRDPRPLVALEDVPVTLAGISTHNTQNAMAAAAAALGIGLSKRVVAEGLRTFVLDPERNPGRANVFEIDGRVVVVDYAHNEAGMRGLIEICRGLRRPGSEIWVTFCAAGDRSDEVMHGVGYLAARGADHVAIAQLHRYLRGREPHDVVDRLRAGAVDGGTDPAAVPDFPDEMRALRWMLNRSEAGDVVAIAALGQRPEIFAFMRSSGGQSVGPEGIRELVRRARAGKAR
jgi:cyanophycin synthetase